MISEVASQLQKREKEVRMLTREEYVDTFVELIRRASTELPKDVVKALQAGRGVESDNSLAQRALDTILTNVDIAGS